jgi:hypothetical protein
MNPGALPSVSELPRPNLGPEQWPESGLGWAIWLIAPLAAAIMFAAAARLWSRRRPANRRPATPIEPSPETASLPAAARRTREALIERFGTSWGAMTTEEVAAQPPMLEALGPERTRRVLRLLSAADRFRFSAEANGDDQGEEDWARWAEEFVAALLAQQTSTISGR